MRNFLLITPFFPEGIPSSGGEQRIAIFRAELQRYGKVFTCVPRKKVKRLVCLSQGQNLFHIPGRVSFRRHPFRAIANRLCKFLFGWLESWENAKTAPFATELLLEEWFPGVRFDAIFLRTFEELRLFRPWTIGLPVYIDLDDSPLESFDTRFCPRLPAWRRAVSRRLFQSRFRRFSLRCAGGWLANPSSIAALGLPPDRFLCLPNSPIPPPPDYRPEETARDSVLFVASFGYTPNIEAMERFLCEVWPAMSKAHPDLILRIAGGGMSSETKVRWEKSGNVEIAGFVPSLASLYERAYATVVPMVSGSGTAIKVMESLAYGRLCLASPFGARGWAEDAVGIRVCAEPETWIREIGDIISMPVERRTAQEDEARATFGRANLKERAAAAVRALVEAIPERTSTSQRSATP